MQIHNLYQVTNIQQEYLCWSISFIFGAYHILLHTEVKKPNFLGRMSADFENIGSFYISLEHFKPVCQQNCWSISSEGECNFYTQWLGQVGLLLDNCVTLCNFFHFSIKCVHENSSKMSMKIHPKRGLFMDKMSTQIYPFCLRKFTFYVHENSTTPLKPFKIPKIELKSLTITQKIQHTT